ncbi:MAG: class I SAM-dependent methyltransferase [Pseudomonadota bacterium]
MTRETPPKPDRCAACGSSAIHHVRQIWARRTRRHLDLYFCDDCESFMMPAFYTPTDETLQKTVAFHERITPRNMEWSTPLWDQVLAHFPGARAVAEIGCGNGALLAEAERRGLSALGFELNPHVAAFARDRFGLDIRESLWDRTTDMPECNVLACISVLEHLEDPAALISEIAAYLKPRDGLAILSVPLIDESRWKHVVRPLAKASPFKSTDEHVQYFSPQGFATLLERCGFTSVERYVIGGWNIHLARP